MSNDDSQNSKANPPRLPTGTQARVSSTPSPPRVIATGQQPRVTPPPQRSDTLAASSGADAPARPITAARAAIAKATNPPPAESAPLSAPAAANGDPYIDTVVAERYKVIRKLGEGGMGVVYLAEHVFIEKRVALKVLSEDFARKADLVARFMQEAKAASKIGHENIVDITDFGETASGSVFFAMEFLDGADLAGHIRDGGAMPFSRARVIMNQICRALGAAHAKGIIHRDMKPENVYLVTREGRPDFVKVLDFGIAKMSALDEGGSRLTRTGMIFGTPEYMSPEQAKGDKPDHRVDIYAAGCILYEMLTGDVPFHAETFMGVLTKHMFEQPQPPSQRNPAAHIAPEIEAVVLKALSKDRDQRYQTMKEFAVAMEACVGGDLTQAWGSEPSGVLSPGLRESSQAFRVGGGSQVGSAVAAAGTTPPLPVAKKRAGLYVAVAAGVLLIGGAAAVLVTQKHPPAAPISVQQAPPPPVVVTQLPALPKAAETPPKPTQFTITLATTPPGADVFNGAERLTVTPGTVVLPASDTPVTLTFKKKGYKDSPYKITPDRNHDLVIDLMAVAHPHPSAASHPAAKIDAPKNDTAAKSEPAAPKAAGKLRDLKDPFAN